MDYGAGADDEPDQASLARAGFRKVQRACGTGVHGGQATAGAAAAFRASRNPEAEVMPVRNPAAGRATLAGCVARPVPECGYY